MGKRGETMYVKEYMNTNIITVTKEMPVAEAHALMRDNNIHRLPVVDDADAKRLVGLLTAGKIREAIKNPGIQIANPMHYLQLLSQMKVKELMETSVITITPNTTLEVAVVWAQRRRMGTLPVVDEGQLVGILTATDLYKITTQALGFGKPGARLHIFNYFRGPAGEITNIITSHGANILSLFHITLPGTRTEDCIIHLDKDNASDITDELRRKGYVVQERS